MSNQNWEEEDFDLDLEEDDTAQSRQTNGNDLIRQLRKAQKAAEKRAKELEAELGSLRAERRESMIRSVLEENGVNPKVAKFIPNDLEPTADALTQWITEYGDVFGVTPSQSRAVDRDSLDRIEATTSSAQIPVGADDILLRLQQAQSADDIINMIYNQ